MTANQQPNTELLEDLCTRFILNVPAEELEYDLSILTSHLAWHSTGSDR